MTESSQQERKQAIIQPHLTRLLDGREHSKTICPSEVARALSKQELADCDYPSWRDAMSDIRMLVAQMRTRREAEVLQKGSVLEGDLGEQLENAVGPLRVRKIL